MELPKRKPNRLKNFDYSQAGAYFITVCTKDKKCLFGTVVGDGVYDIPYVRLTQTGKIVNKYIDLMNEKYHNIFVDKYIIMPNHIHLIICIQSENPTGGSLQAPNPTNAIIPKFISLFKRYCNREIGNNIFQRSFHDHIIRNEDDYRKIWEYIDTNAFKWKEDCFYYEQ